MILYGGSYTQEVGPGLSGTGDGIYCFDFDEVSGSLKLIHTLENRNTSYLAISKNKKYLFSFQEVLQDKKPVVLSFTIKDDYSLTQISSQPIEGGLPCHLDIINDDTLAVACYETGSTHLYPINENGSLEPCIQKVQNVGTSINVERQECAHSHMVSKNDNQLFIPDLGIDKVVVLDIIENRVEEAYKIEIPLGEGPRHIVFHPSNEVGFVINELTGGVSIVKKINKKFEVVETVYSLPNDYKETPSAAGIKMSPDGNYLYVSNRGIESIAIFKFDVNSTKLELINQQSTLGETPRDFTISPDGEWLVVANQDTNNLVVFKINKKTGLLSLVNNYDGIHSVVCLKWM